MDYQSTETEIYQRLQDRIPPISGIELEVLPENQAGFSRPLEHGRVSVCYKASSFGEVRSTCEVVQDETPKFELIIQSTTLRGAKGIYALAKLVRAVLLGYKPQTTGGKITLVDFGYTNYKDNMWTYTMTIQTGGMVVEAPEEVDEILLAWITIPDLIGDEVEIYGTAQPAWQDEENFNDENTIP